MINLGDFTAGKTIICRFNTHKADGTPITLAGTPAVLCYKNSTTESASTGITLTVDYDSRTGLHHVAIDTSANSSFFAEGNDFDIVITAGTVDSISVVGTVVGTFSLANRSALRPTTADRTLLVASDGKTTDANSHSAADVLTAFAGKLGALTVGPAQTPFVQPQAVWVVADDDNHYCILGPNDPLVYANENGWSVAYHSGSGLWRVTRPDGSIYAGGYYYTIAGWSDVMSYVSGPTVDDVISTCPATTATPGDAMTLTSGERSSIAAAVLGTAMPAVSGVATTFGGAVAQLWRRFFKKATKSAIDIKTYADDGSTVITTQTISVSGDDETQGTAT